MAGKDDAAEAEGSNSLFRQLRAFAFGAVARHHPDGEATGSRGEFEQEVVTHAYEIADACCASERQAKATAMKVAMYAWEHFDGGRWKMKQNWGVCAAQTKGLTEAEAKAVGGRYAAARRREASVETLVAAYRRLAAECREPSRAAVAGEAGLCVRTAERRWDEVMRAVALANAEPAVEGMTIAPLDKKVIPADGQENAAGGQQAAADGAMQAVTAVPQPVIGAPEPDLLLPAGSGRCAGAKHVDGEGRLGQGRHPDAWFAEGERGGGTRARLGHVGDGCASEPVTASLGGHSGGRPGIVVRSVRRRTMTPHVSPTVVVRTTGRP
ncbi:hypothetical protein FW320_00365 [Azospirillum sp. Vi22]|uniref:hypothetical protein n=1 Tax=Azospirillum baldaniorum TaxID=1064539 RepID=UPI00157B8493|nr:hypothetical protein [Azospirillum baldaniorum]NUB04649.1 hypothetical protein [Azospirillum baldaniorum]